MAENEGVNQLGPPSVPQITADDLEIRKVDVRPIALLKAGKNFLGDRYGLFLGITVVGILIGSVVPLGILLGPMMVGIYLCFLIHERGEKVEFADLFKKAGAKPQYLLG